MQDSCIIKLPDIYFEEWYFGNQENVKKSLEENLQKNVNYQINIPPLYASKEFFLDKGLTLPQEKVSIYGRKVHYEIPRPAPKTLYRNRDGIWSFLKE